MTAELDAWIVATVTAHPGITLYELSNAQLEEFPERYERLSNPKQSARSRITKRLHWLVKSGFVSREKGPKVHKYSPAKEVWHYYPDGVMIFRP